jgi:hypothetical protein
MPLSFVSTWETMSESVAFHEIRQSNLATIGIVQQIKLFANLQDVFLCYLSHLLQLVYDELGFTISKKKKKKIQYHQYCFRNREVEKKNEKSIKTLKEMRKSMCNVLE